jgi:hypothetical protein
LEFVVEIPRGEVVACRWSYRDVPVHDVEDGADPKRFGHVAIGTGFYEPLDGSIGRVAGNDIYRYGRYRGVFTDVLKHLAPVERRQIEVEQDEVGLAATDQIETAEPICFCQDLDVRAAPQNSSKELYIGVIIVDDDDAGASFRYW